MATRTFLYASAVAAAAQALAVVSYQVIGASRTPPLPNLSLQYHPNDNLHLHLKLPPGPSPTTHQQHGLNQPTDNIQTLP